MKTNQKRKAETVRDFQILINRNRTKRVILKTFELILFSVMAYSIGSRVGELSNSIISTSRFVAMVLIGMMISSFIFLFVHITIIDPILDKINLRTKCYRRKIAEIKYQNK